MKIALVALPHLDGSRTTPPLPLCYLAAVFEQQRHIVRVYDLALRASDLQTSRLDAIRAFRPHVTIVAADDVAEASAIAEQLRITASVAPLTLGVRDHLPPWLVSRALADLHRLPHLAPDIVNLVACGLLALDEPLDNLPFPARHLLPLEQYPIATPEGELRTPIVIGRVSRDGAVAFRQPALLVTELRSIVQEHGVRHVILEGPALTDDRDWLYAFLSQISRMHLGIKWEGRVSHARLTPGLIAAMHRSGCEALTFEFDALSVLDAKRERDALIDAVQRARDLGMRVNGHIALDPQYPSIPAVVDMSATFGLDEVRFFVLGEADTPIDSEAPSEVAALIARAREHYQISRSRQYFVDRFGARLGTMIWYVGRAGLLGKCWRRHVQHEEAASEIALEHGRIRG
ncbi:MAG: hypothetical protein NZ699_00105 [Roseiflexus sp.]|nr:hypothetical protein [Roseiflexus sp.]MCS7287510.1 hypothetical protein [Roseiflexus sp.]MDW8146193.1 hypothetical protein [Roseiflexaceae bacterium]MDW8231366.1 hypothetical protein [Roseiflexaceae bacterium]